MRGDFDMLYDTFVKIDREASGSIRRVDFVWATGAFMGEKRFNLAIQRANLRSYFRQTAKDMDLETYFRRALPAAEAYLVGQLMRMANWEKVRTIVASGNLQATQTSMRALHACFVQSPEDDVAWEDLEECGILHRSDMKHTSVDKHFSIRGDPRCLSFKHFAEAVLLKYWHPVVATPSELKFLCSMGYDNLASIKGLDLAAAYKSSYKEWRGKTSPHKLAPLNASVMDRLHDYVEENF